MGENDPIGVSSAGFLKVGSLDPDSLDRSKRAALIRKGNELFNDGHYDMAQRIFLTVRYSDGLIRLGNYRVKQGRPLDAFRLFWVARDRRRIDEMAEQMAGVLRHWLQEDE
ncbi:MAG: hypothetical protein WCY01_02275 [Alkalispirochaeta sp.]|jgi:hypothetical protein